MRPIKHIHKHKDNINQAIKKYGHCVEHNYHHYKYCEGDGEKNYFFKLGNKKGILSSFDEKEDIWYLFPSGILAPEEERFEIFSQLMDHAFEKQKVSKMCVEVNQDFRKEIIKKLRSCDKYRACKSYEILYWPMYKMKNFDPNLRGKNWKKLRNIKNRFYKKHKVKIVDSKTVDKQELKKVLNSWLKKRNANDHVDKYYYENMIDNNFKGTDMAKTIIVDGKPSSITAGWKVPNTNNYYSHVGILDYSYPGLGEVANIEDLRFLKKKNYDYADFGGSDKVLLYFKKKFKPESVYKTYLFSIVQK